MNGTTIVHHHPNIDFTSRIIPKDMMSSTLHELPIQSTLATQLVYRASPQAVPLPVAPGPPVRLGVPPDGSRLPLAVTHVASHPGLHPGSRSAGADLTWQRCSAVR